MKLLSFNVLNGAFHPADRLQKVIQVIQSIDPDVCLLQECTDWSLAQLKLLSRSLGMKHCHIVQCNPRSNKKCYNLSALSKTPFLEGKAHTPEIMAHGCQELQLEGCPFPIFNIHLIAGSEEGRLQELEWFLGEERTGILAGDLNALSSDDPYPSDFASRLQEAGVDKYGHPPKFEVYKRLKEAGWSTPTPSDDQSWVTRWRNELDPPLPTRTDYIMAHGAATETLKQIQIVPL
ncbi:MAG: endonuclease/exonuclease/phosphatase family protein, partial [Vulcanimicrobiota bacterium]